MVKKNKGNSVEKGMKKASRHAMNDLRKRGWKYPFNIQCWYERWRLRKDGDKKV